MMADELRWTCHVCHEERLDRYIAVLSTNKSIGGVPVRMNVRYCNDRPACIEGAKDVNFLKGAEETL